MASNKFKKFFIMGGLALLVIVVFNSISNDGETVIDRSVSPAAEEEAKLKPAVAATKPKLIPAYKLLPTEYHMFQTFNNCAPAALSMALAHYDIRVSQEALAKALRPFNNLQGKNDDKSTPPEELADKARDYALLPYYRGGGDIELLKQIIAADLPVIVRTLLHDYEDFAHYRVIKGYDSNTGELIQDDGYEGKNLRFTYEKFLKLWKPFNNAYLALVPPEKKEEFEEILGKFLDEKASWQNAEAQAEEDTAKNLADKHAWFNLSVARYHTGDYQGSVQAFEKIEKVLPIIYTWYQVEPIRSYFELENYDRVFALTEKILLPGNLAFTELYMIRGESYLAMGKPDLAKEEFRKAVYYNVNYEPARKALSALE